MCPLTQFIRETACRIKTMLRFRAGSSADSRSWPGRWLLGTMADGCDDVMVETCLRERGAVPRAIHQSQETPLLLPSLPLPALFLKPVKRWISLWANVNASPGLTESNDGCEVWRNQSPFSTLTLTIAPLAHTKPYLPSSTAMGGGAIDGLSTHAHSDHSSFRHFSPFQH